MMDALLTTFLSTAPIMVPPWAMEESLVEQYFVELDLSQSLNKGLDYFATSLSISQGGNVVEFSAEGYVGCQLNQGFGGNHRSSVTYSPYDHIFQHQLHQIAHKQRQKNTLQTKDVSSYFLETSACNRSSTMFSNGAEAPCPCHLLAGTNSSCEIHGLVFQSVERTVFGCTWVICLEVDEDPNSSDEDESDDAMDTFEIEFSSEICVDSCVTNVTFSHTSSFVFDLSSDEESDTDGDEECYWSPTTQMKFLRNEMSTGAKNCIQNGGLSIGPTKSNSKFHSHCSHSHNNNNKSKIPESWQGDKKRVHFPTEPSKLVQVKKLYAWPYASKQSRKSVWFRAAQDRVHFKRKIDHKFSDLLNPMLEEKYAKFQLAIQQ